MTEYNDVRNPARRIETDIRPGRLRTLPWMAFYYCLSTQFTPLAAALPEFQDHESIRDAAAFFLKAKTAEQTNEVQIDIGRLDERLNLAACNGKLDAFLPPGSRATGNLTIGVRCAGPKPWTIYMPAGVKVFGSIVVTRRALPRGVTLHEDDLVVTDVELSTLTAGYIEHVPSAIGKQLKTALGKGATLTPRILEQPRLVRRGERVVISAQGDGMDIRMEGKALADGLQGERIRVQNLGSRRIIEATVTSAGVVQVRM